MGAEKNAARFRALDGWRGFVAPMIALFHFHINSHIASATLIRHSWVLVDFFFVLSGFVITHAYAGRLGAWPERAIFLLRRLARLWPLHVTMLALFVALECYSSLTTGAGFTSARSPFAIVTNLLLIQSLGLHNSLTWNTPAWAVSTEFYTYIAFVAVVALRAGEQTRAVLSLVIAAASVAILIFVSRYGMHETFGFGYFRCLYGFFLGAFTHTVWSKFRLNAALGSAAEIAMTLIVIAYLLFALGHPAFEYLATPLFALMVWVFASDSGIVSRLLMSRVCEKLGAWSYAIYMVQMFIITLIFSALDSFHAGSTGFESDGSEEVILRNAFVADAFTLVYLAVVIGIGALAWRFIEIPGQSLFGSGKVAPVPARGIG